MNCKIFDDLLIVPNYAVNRFLSSKAEALMIPPDQVNFLQEVISYGLHTQLIATLASGVNFKHGAEATPKKLRTVAVTGCGSGTSILGRVVRILATVIAVIRGARRCKYVYIYLPGYVGLISGFWFALIGRPYGVYVRGGIGHLGRAGKQAYLFVCRKASFALCTGPALSMAIATVQAKSFPVRPMLSFDVSDCVLDEEKIEKRELGALRVIYVGALTRKKGVIDVVESIRLLNQKGIDCECRLVGAGDAAFVETISERIGDSGLSSKIELLGFSSGAALRALFEDSDLLIFPSIYNEGFPRVIYEAMATGVVVAVYPHEYTSGFLFHGKNSLVSKERSPESLASTIHAAWLENHWAIIRKNAYSDVHAFLERTGPESHAQQIIKKFNETESEKSICI